MRTVVGAAHLIANGESTTGHPPANAAPTHFLLGHTGGILVLGLTGFLLGYLWSLYTRRAA